MTTYHSLLTVPDQQALISASAMCAPHRTNPKQHSMAVQGIDVVVARIRASRPEKFWTATDPAYQRMTAQWDADRKARAAQ